MKTWVTPGGVHPPENKHQSLTLPIGTLPLPEKLLIPRGISNFSGSGKVPMGSVSDWCLFSGG